VVDSNDPDEGAVLIPVTLHVTGAPDIAVTPAAIDFGTLYLGYTAGVDVVVSNVGTDDLVVTDVYTGISEFQVSPGTPWTISPGGSMPVTVTFDPSAATSYTDVLTIESDDSDEPIVTVALSGSAVEPPEVFVDPTSLHASLYTGESEDQDVELSNSGGTDYDWTASVNLITGTGSSTIQSFLDLGKEEEDPRPGILGSGGPDAYGYRWSDSDEPGGPTFSWVDITSVGTLISGLDSDDESIGPLPIGFDFPFYGNTFDEFRACTNGFISFTSTATGYSNQPLPNSGYNVAENMIAPWWDDQNFYYTERAYYYNDGSRLVIEYLDVDHYGYTGTYTYEVILYPNGTIVFQYLSMTGLIDDATIGIQNAARDDGLTVVYNSGYVHDGMAIRLAAMPQWLTVSPTSGAVPPAGSETITAHIDASGLEGGDYEAEVVITGADPLDPSVTLPVTLHVTGAPDIVVNPTDIDFGLVYLGYSRLTDLYIRNEGTDVLHVTNITSTSPDFSVDVTSLNVPPHGEGLVTARFSPTAVGTRTGELHVISNDSDAPDVAVAVQGNSLVAPDIGVSPTSLFADLLTDDIEAQTITVSNTGGSDLDFTVETRVAGAVEVQEYLDVPKGEVDPRPGQPAAEGQGGPDVFGYRWIDSDEAGGPVFGWVDITGVGTQIPMTGDDSHVGPLPIGFDFPFYGNTFSEFYISCNGFVSFDPITLSYYTNQPLPNSGAPANMLAPWWDDLNFGTVESAYYHYDGDRLIVEFYEVPHLGTGGPYTFEVILYPNGTIKYQYLSMADRLTEATIGIQNATKDDGLQVVYNAAYVHDNMAIRISLAPQWLTVLPESGTVPPGSSVDLTTTFDATGLFGGDYNAAINISSNDPDEGVATVAAHMHVTGTPDIACSPEEMDCGTVYVGLSTDDVMTVTNEGTDLLTVTNIASDNPDFTVDMTSFSLNPLESMDVTVTFAPSVAGMRTGTLTIYSNDPDTPEELMAMSGMGLMPPEIVPVPDAVSAACHPDIPRTKTLQICNEGGSDLTFSLTFAEATGVTVEGYSSIDLDKTDDVEGAQDQQDPRPGILGSGGPDAFGHIWIDSDDPGGPVYDWVDISGVGTPTFSGYSDDGNRGPFPIGFDFPFYENVFDEFRICSNGWVSFTSSLTGYTNDPLPSSGAAENLLAVFWDDMVVDPSYGDGEVYYYNDGSRLIIQYQVRRIATYSPPWFSFEVILYPNGDIVYQYNTLGAVTNSCTIGIQNQAKDDGLMMVFDDAYVHENMAILISSAPGWLNVEPTEGTVAAGECVDLTVHFDPTAVGEGEYDGQITINSNDPYNPVITVPVHMIVNLVEATYVDVDPNTLNLSSMGNYVSGHVELPDPYNVEDILIETVLFEYTVAADPELCSIGNDRLMVKFPRAGVQGALSVGDNVPVTIVGEIDGVAWFTGTDYIRVINPTLKNGPGDEVAMADGDYVIAWDPPEGHTVDYYGLYFSSDAGESWSVIADHVVGTSYSWRTPNISSDQCLLRLYALDGLGVMGYDTSDLFVLSRKPGKPKPEDPKVFVLFQNEPNPAFGTTAIRFNLPAETLVSLKIFDASGKLVRNLVDKQMPPGRQSVVWDGKNDRGQRVSAGVYFYSIEAGQNKATKKLLLVQ
jgi:hypothetical protein